MATIESLYNQFQRDAVSTRKLLTVADSCPRMQGNLIVELAFLRGLNSWEVLVEESFVAYMLGKKSRSGRSYRSLMRSGVTESHARTALLSGRDFLDWIPQQSVGERGTCWFPGDDEFLTRALAAIPDLSEIRRIRNRIAHDSGDAQAKFQALRANHIANPAKRKGMGPGQFLRSTSKYVGTSTSCMRFERYMKELDDAAAALTA